MRQRRRRSRLAQARCDSRRYRRRARFLARRRRTASNSGGGVLPTRVLVGRCFMTIAQWHRVAQIRKRFRLVLVFAQVGDYALWTLGRAREADVAAVQDQPMMRIETELLGHELQQARFDL